MHAALRLRTQMDVMLVDACPTVKNQEACATVLSGILKRGMFAGLQNFVQLLFEALDTRGEANGSEDVVRVSRLGRVWSGGLRGSRLPTSSNNARGPLQCHSASVPGSNFLTARQLAAARC